MIGSLEPRDARFIVPPLVASGIAGMASEVLPFAVQPAPVHSLVGDVVVGGALPFRDRLTVLVGLYPFLGTSFSPGAGAALLLVAALVGARG
jgi:hypothetical protein